MIVFGVRQPRAAVMVLSVFGSKRPILDDGPSRHPARAAADSMRIGAAKSQWTESSPA
jgi:hypothetical protein